MTDQPHSSPAGSPFDDLAVTVQLAEPLAKHTWLGVGGVAQYFCEPVSVESLSAIVSRCNETKIKLRVIGGGSNVLVPSEGVEAMVIRLSAPPFCGVEVDGQSVRVGAGAKLVHLVSAAVQEGLSGLEDLVGIPGTVGGGLVGNAAAHGCNLGQRVHSVTVMLPDGTTEDRLRDDIAFASSWSSLDGVIVLSARFDLDEDDPEQLTKRMQKQWIVERSEQPSGTRSVAMMFKDPVGTTAESLITQAGCRDVCVGNASIYASCANYVVTTVGCPSSDVQELVEKVRAIVREKLGVELAPRIRVW
ncbi:MAG: UDP-N-acetylmuramate dehydrogenase [Pirellulales bacterium]|jgi:UDP-N-acetylmuramate dehydrogenase|nr:UDP-N-acetylmuramate dehydrogenase [Pirellulales bacterium]MDP6676351.1 UDP-N-acetylmuramate dehydrogenase [Pirellulales bacterium]MEE2796715.1 UDP-N-acetylmuramate dehydrogenase [Planctomycetota bacterium]|tara:strand:+ start:606 stop:1514 length:909 start_codon:yes stop_codon:yes gene_type:complete